jgi:hypothetical protein
MTKMLDAEPQLFCSDLQTTCAFFAGTLCFTVAAS